MSLFFTFLLNICMRFNNDIWEVMTVNYTLHVSPNMSMSVEIKRSSLLYITNLSSLFRNFYTHQNNAQMTKNR